MPMQTQEATFGRLVARYVFTHPLITAAGRRSEPVLDPYGWPRYWRCELEIPGPDRRFKPGTRTWDETDLAQLVGGLYSVWLALAEDEVERGARPPWISGMILRWRPSDATDAEPEVLECALPGVGEQPHTTGLTLSQLEGLIEFLDRGPVW